MLEETIENFTARIKETVLTDEKMTIIPLAYLQTLKLPESIMHFFNQEIEINLRDEEKKFESERFDYDQPEVRMLIDKIFDKLQQNAVFDLQRFNHLLERAIKLELGFVVEPQWTLTQFIFKDADKVSTMDVYDTLKYFFKFEYYKNAISDYFNTKYLREIARDQFKDLIKQIDQNAYKENPVATALSTFKSIMSTFSEARKTEITTLSKEVASKAMKDRGLDDFFTIIDGVDQDQLTLTELEQLLKNGKLAGEETAAEETVAEEIAAIEEKAPEVNVAEIEVKESTLAAEEVEEEDEEDEEEDEEEEEVAKPAKKDVAGSLADYVAGQISSDAPLADINSLIVGRQRRKIIKKLFKKKEDQFNSFINSLNAESSWKIASKIIDDAFYEREINPYSKEAIMLSDLIYNRFFPKDKYVGKKRD